MKAEALKKVANILRSQEQEKIALQEKYDSLKTDSDINRTVLNMLKEDLLDTSDIDSKVAEFKGDPDFLKRTKDFFEKNSEVGEISGKNIPEVGKAEESFWSCLSSN